MDSALARLSPDEAHEILQAHARRSFGDQAGASRPSFHAEDGVWEAWVTGVAEHVRAYILRPQSGDEGWACMHVRVHSGAPGL